MFTKILNGQRQCLDNYDHINSWSYIKGVLYECGFEETQRATSKEYIMKGCEGKVLIYVKFNTDLECTIVFLNDKDSSSQLKLNWSRDYRENGDLILEEIRSIWSIS